jgi:LysR family transcriptional regulator, carnitine catabolism transcriptional activator
MPFKLATSHLSLRQLRAFLAVAQESSMTRAATRLHLTPSALSMLVRSMEEDLGMRLFERTTRRVVLTDAGQQFLPTVEQVFLQLDGGIARLQQSQRLKASQLRVAASPLLASALFPKVIASFRAQHPQVTVVLMDAPIDALPDLVRRGEVDMAVCTAHSDVADLASHLLYVDKLMLACHVDHPLAQAREVSWPRLVEEPLILMRHGSGLRSLVDKTLAKWSKQIRPAYEVSQVATALGLVAEGEGVSILPSYAISRAQAASQALSMATVPLVGPVVEREIVALMPNSTDASVVVAAFIEHFKKHAGQF